MNQMSVQGRDDEDRIAVEVVDTGAGLAELRRDWEALYRQDPDANAFLSWSWLSAAFRAHPLRWTVLAARDRESGRLLGLLPLKNRVHWSGSRQRFETELEGGGRLVLSPRTGLLCDPVAERGAVRALAREALGLPWTRLTLAYVAPTPRMALLAEMLAAGGAEISWSGGTDADAPAKYTDLVVSLPEDARSLAAAAPALPEGIALRRLKGGAAESAFDALIAAAGAEGDRRALRRLSGYRAALATARASDRLMAMAALRGDAVVAMAVHVTDDLFGEVVRLTSHAPRDDLRDALTFATLVRAAEQGFLAYDFGRDQAARPAHLLVDAEPAVDLSARRDPADPGLVLDIQTTGLALERMQRFLRDGKIAAAEAGCAQLRALFA
ncbi:GNAT family N-acetyltransferase [Roseivivax sp. CAU 1761]